VKRDREQGSVMLETVFMLPVILTLIMGIGQFAHILLARQVVTYAAYASARAALPMSDQKIGGAQSEAEFAALQAAKQICAPITLGGEESSGAKQLRLPWVGEITGSEAVGKKLRVSLAHSPNQFESVTVEMDFPLVFPVAGNLIGGLANLLTLTGEAESGEPEGITWSHRYESGFFFPHIMLRETAVAAKPFTVVNMNNLPTGYNSY